MNKSMLTGFKIAPRLAMLFVLFGLLPAAGVFLAFEMSKSNFKDAIRKPIAQTAIAIGDVIDRNLFERYRDVQAFALNVAVREPANWRNPSNANPLVAAMNGYMTAYGIYTLMLLVDPSGRVLAANSVGPQGNPADTASLYEQSFAGASWFKKALAGEFLNGADGMTGTVVEQPRRIDVVASVTGGDGYAIPFAAPVKAADGSVLGVWVNFADFGLVEEIVGSFYRSLAAEGKKDAELTVLDPQGNIIVDYDPLGQGWSEYKRNPEVIGRFNLAKLGVGAAVRAVKGESGSVDATHARKNMVQASGYARTTGAYDYPGLGWSVLVRIPAEDAYVAIAEEETIMKILIGISGIVILVLGFLMGRSVASPIKGMTEYMGRLARGDLESDVPALDRKDEIGQMAASVQAFKANAVEKVALEQRREADEARAEEEKRAMMQSLADEFEKAVGDFIEGLGSTATELQSAAQTLTAAAEETSTQSSTVSAASEEAAANAHSVASAVEELSASVQEIAQQISVSSDISQQAVGEARGATENIESLALAGQKIGKVVNLINDIAEQTNLLALNATIEAARAGEAGKGFAVVASAVKQLAEQTAKATSQIADQVAQMQEATDGTVSSIQSVSTVIEKINEIGTGIAASVEEQNSATEEIARNVQESAAASTEVSSNITGVSRAAEETGAAASQVLAGSNEISDQAARLRTEVGNFLEKVRAA